MHEGPKTLPALPSVGWVVLATVLYTLALPPFDLSWLAFLVAAPLAVVFLDPARRLGRGQVLAAALVFGEGSTLAVGGHWLYYGAHGFFGKSAAVSLGFTLLTTVTHAGIFIAAAAASSALLARLRSRVLRVLGFACIWVAWELVRSRILYGCPWDLLGHALYRHPTLMQASALGGTYLLSGLCVACGAALGLAYVERRRPPTAFGLVSLGAALLAGTAAWGAARMADTAASRVGIDRQPLRVAMVQANVGRQDLWDPNRRTDHLDRLIEMSRAPELRGADLVVWAENAVPFLLDADAAARDKISRLARELDAFVLTGAPRADQDGAGHARFYNSVYLFSPDGADIVTYDKIKLLPYIERTPAWALSLLRPNRALEASPGDGLRLFDVRGWKIAPLICFESTYPELAREALQQGADLLLNVSNDSWFDAGAAPQQHFAMTLMRAPELGVPLVRVANTGISAVVDTEGRVVRALPPKQAAVALADVPARLPGSPYERCGDVFAWSCVMLAILFALAGTRASRLS